MGTVRRLVAATVLALSACTLTVVQPAAADEAGDEAAFLTSLNDLRASQGLPTLRTHDALVAVARTWARAMAAAGSISHNPSLAVQGPAEWQRLGENVGMGMDVPVVHNAFVNSPAHYRNMVDGGFDSVGIGVVRTASGALFVTVNFMQAQAASPAPAPAPAPAPPAPATAAPAPTVAAAPAAPPAPAPPAPAATTPAAAAASAPAAVPAPPAEPAAAPVAASGPVAAEPDPAPAATLSATPAASTQGASAPSVALALIGAGVLLVGAAGAMVARRPERRAAALARR